MSINPSVQFQQVLSTSLEQRSPGWVDIISNAIPLFDAMKRKDMWQPYEGPEIRERILYNLPTAQWYGAYDILNNPPIELLNDAVYTPKQVVAPISISGRERLGNLGRAQLIDIISASIGAAEKALSIGIEASSYSDGTLFGGKELGGLNLALPINPALGTYAGISRVNNPLWRPKSFNAATAFPTIGTVVDSTTIRPMLNSIYNQCSRGPERADLLLMSAEHWDAYDASLVAHQRICDENGAGRLGFKTLSFVGGGSGRGIEIVYAGGFNSFMPSSTTFGVNTDTFSMRYNPQRNFDKLFGAEGAMPINQDAIAQFVGWMGEMTQNNPVTNFRFYG